MSHYRKNLHICDGEKNTVRYAYCVKQGLPHVIASLPQAGEAISSPTSLGELMGTRQFYVYIMTNNRNTVLYTSVTNNIRKRVYEHRQKLVEGIILPKNQTSI